MKITREIDLDEHRCYECGTFWAVERGKEATCPVCAQRNIHNAYQREDRAIRSARSLKAILDKRNE